MEKLTYGFDSSPHAYKGTSPGVLPMIAVHRFFETADHQLGHEIDGKLRAVVPPEGWDDYVECWPDAADVVATLRKPASADDEEAAAAGSAADLLGG